MLQALRDLAGDATLAGIPFAAVAQWADRVGLCPFWLVDRVRAVEAVRRELEDERAERGQREGEGE